MSALSFSNIRKNSTEETSAADRYLAEQFKIVARTMISYLFHCLPELNSEHHPPVEHENFKPILSDLQPKT